MKSFFAFFTFILLTTSCFTAPLIKNEITSNKIKRTYFIHVPSSYRKNKTTVPLVFLFHGGGGTAQGIARFSGFNRLSQKHGFLVVYPQGINKHWNDGRKSEKFKEHDTTIDDVAYIKDLLIALKAKYSIDPKKVFATGISNGGIFSQRLAIELGEHFVAVASLTAQIAEPLRQAKTTNPVSIMIINGTKDPFVPYTGGEVTPYIFPRLAKLKKQPSRGKVISTDDTIAFWLKSNDLPLKGTTKKLPDLNKIDGTTVERTEWKSSHTNVRVVLYKIIGGGHTWPGKKQYLPVKTIGKTCQDIDASEKIWDFFKNQSRLKPN